MTTLASSALLPVLFPFRSLPREAKLLTLFLAFAPCFVILSICAEGLFYVAYCATLLVWVEVETAVRKAQEESYTHDVQRKADVRQEDTVKTDEDKGKSRKGGYRIRVDDVRIALFFLFFVQVAFFGTGK